MCIALPAKIREMRGTKALVDSYSGLRREIDCALHPEARAGDYLLAYGGRAMKLMAKAEADELIALLNQVAGRKKLFDIIKKGKLGFDDIHYLLTITDPEEVRLLQREADRLREVFLRKTVCVHGVIEFSNHCASNCAYCGLAKSNGSIVRYRMEPDEIISVARTAVADLGFKMIVLQSGEDEFYDDDTIVRIVREIRKGRSVLIFLSVGERGETAYRKFREAGAKGVLFRFETSDGALYRQLHPDSDHKERLRHLKFMKTLGFLVASGPLLGLAGQTIATLVNDILLMRELKIDMASIGVFIPHKETPLSSEKGGSVDTTVRFIAATRMALSPNMRIPIATSLESIDTDNARLIALASGGNSLMLNLTPLKYRRDYSIYPGRFGENESVQSLVDKAQDVVKSLGRRVCKGWGTRLKVQESADEFLPVCE